MYTRRRMFLLAATASLLAVAIGPAQAGEDPIPLIDVVVEKTPPGHAFYARTDTKGYISYRSLSAGNYVVSDRYGNKASLKHPGGPARWRLVGTKTPRGPVWTLVDESNPL